MSYVGVDLASLNVYKPPSPVASTDVRSKVVTLLLLIHWFSYYVWEFCVWSLFCYSVLSVLSSFAFILLGTRENCLLYFNCPTVPLSRRS